MITTPDKIIIQTIAPSGARTAKTCECGAEYFDLFKTFTQTKCADCLDAERLEVSWPIERKNLIQASIAGREGDWATLCPLEYQKPVESQLLRFPAAFHEALRWEFGRKGLLLTGISGGGKSRAIWLLAKREFIAGRSIRVLDVKAALDYASAYSNSARDAESFARGFCECDLVLFDDTFRGKLTDSFEQAIFIIVERRTSSGLPILAAINDTGATLEARMSPDRGKALVRRLRDYCLTIRMGEPL